MIILACIIIGVLLFIGMMSFRSYGGAFGSQNVRDRMDSAGSDLNKKRRQDLGLEPEDEKDN
ncbi:MAG: hypothetical protein IIZ47_02070 [Erysipelotrichaceae bacterium]|nr:hypothetical protein [Erysipelotrichaceae bacterium]